MPNLLKILPGELSDGLTTAEAGLLRAAASGEALDLRTGDFVLDRPENAGLWDTGRTIRGEFFSWLCRSMPYAFPAGISVIGARVDGPVNLDSAGMQMPIGLLRCSLDDIILLDASIPSVTVSECTCGELVADGLRASGDVVIDRLKARGEVRFNGASVRSLYGRGSKFESRGVYAFSADRLEAKFNLDLTGAFSSGWIRMLDVRLGGGITLDRLRVHNYGSYSVSLDKLAATGGFSMRGAELAGEFRMRDASVGGVFEVSGSWCRNPGDVSFDVGGLRGGLDVLFERVSLQGTLALDGANIGGSLTISGSTLDGTGLSAVSGTGFAAGAGVFLRDTSFAGDAGFGRADIHGSLYVQRSRFEGGMDALGLEGARISGLLSIGSGTSFTGRLELSGAKAGRFSDARDSWPAPGSLSIDGFGYGWLHGRGTPLDGPSRVEWLRLMPKRPFRRGPYVQLARILHLMGRERDMRTVVEAMYEDMKAAGELRLAKRAWRWLRQGKGDLDISGL